METPVYVFAGFLDSGKTSFINETLQSGSFAKKNDRILVLLCEEGENEVDTASFGNKNISVEALENQNQLNPDKLEALRKKHNANIVMLEYNGMWRMPELYNALPADWQIVDIMTFVDASSFDMYYNNVRDLFTDKVIDAGFVVFNRCVKDETDEQTLHKAVRMSNTFTKIAYEYTDGSYALDDIEDPLPFDKDSDEFIVNLTAYGPFYRDISENMEDYDGKTVTFTGFCQKAKGLIKKGFVIGRYVMNCCEADAVFCGFYVENGEKEAVFNDWMSITAKISIKPCSIYGREGPVLTMISAEKTEAPPNPMASFY